MNRQWIVVAIVLGVGVARCDEQSDFGSDLTSFVSDAALESSDGGASDTPEGADDGGGDGGAEDGSVEEDSPGNVDGESVDSTPSDDGAAMDSSVGIDGMQ